MTTPAMRIEQAGWPAPCKGGRLALLLGCLLLSSSFNLSAWAQGTAFTYNGRLNDSGNPAAGSYDLRFTLCNAVTNGSVIGSLTNLATGVSNGLFTVTLDFGGVFNGANCWLELAARTNGGGAFTVLNPRQPIMPVPYAIYAATAGSAATATSANSASSVLAANVTGTLALPQLPGAVLTNTETGVTISGTFNGNGGGLTNLNPANLASGYASSLLNLTNPFNVFNGNFSGFHYGDGSMLTNLSPRFLASGYASSLLNLTNPFNVFNGNFSGFHYGDGSMLTNLSPRFLASGYASSLLNLTNQFNVFNGNFSGFHYGDGSMLTNLSPRFLASGYASSLLNLTNQFNVFNGNFSGFHYGDGSALTNLSVDAVTGGLTIKLAVLVPGGGTNTLCFTNGILRAIQ